MMRLAHIYKRYYSQLLELMSLFMKLIIEPRVT